MYKTDLAQVSVMKTIIIVLISILIGYGISYISFTHKLEQKNILLESNQLELENKMHKLKSKMSLISTVDIKDYLELKDNRAKFEKANEILGKIMIIFLADLKLHFDKKILEPVSSSLDLKDNILPVKKIESHQESREKVNDRKELPEQRDYFEDSNVSLKTTKNRLKKIRIKNPSHLSKSLPMKKSNLLFRKINGYFSGKLFLEKGPIDLINSSIEFRFDKSKVIGKVEVSISRNGNRYGHLRANGDNENVLYLKNKPKQVILKISPSSYLQLIYIKRSDSFIGNYYENHKFAGLAKLIRK